MSEKVLRMSCRSAETIFSVDKIDQKLLLLLVYGEIVKKLSS